MAKIEGPDQTTPSSVRAKILKGQGVKIHFEGTQRVRAPEVYIFCLKGHFKMTYLAILSYYKVYLLSH